MAIPEEKQKSSDLRFDGKLIKVTYDIADIAGKEAWREVVHHPGAAAIVPVLDDGRIVMERQYRYAIQTPLLEIPAGKLDGSEDPLVCAKRELQEETGYTAKHWDSLGTIATSAGFSNEKIHIYLAKGLTAGQTHFDDDEYVELSYMKVPDLLEALRKEEVKDAKTLAALLLALPKLM